MTFRCQRMRSNKNQPLASRPRKPWHTLLRPVVEELGERTLPNATPAVLPIQQLAVDIAQDVTKVQADLQGIRASLSTNTNTTITTDLTTLGTDLTHVTADLSAGLSATSDLSALASAQAQLTTDLGTTITPALTRQLNGFSHAVTDLTHDVSQVGERVSEDLASVQADAHALTTALTTGASVSATTTTDITAVNTDLSAVVADFAAGRSATADITTLMTAEDTLKTDLGHNVSNVIRRDLHNLQFDTRALAIDVAQATHLINRTADNILRDDQTLMRALASNTDATVVADVQALHAALLTVSADVTAGNASTAADVNAAITAQAKLTTDLGTSNVSPVQHKLSDLGSDLLELAIALSSLKT